MMASSFAALTHHDEDAEEEEEEEEEGQEVLALKLMNPGSGHVRQEKPVFPSSPTDSRLSVPLELSYGDRVPYTINRYLRDYQREGIRFIYNNYSCSRGCVLGDDMGLGKTVQVIGFLAAVLHKTGTWEDIENNRPQFLQSQAPSEQSRPKKVFLIVAPLSVLYNWKNELDTWGNFQCVVVHGLRKEEELARIQKGRIEIALTTYETLRLSLDHFNNIDWSAVIVDEVHKIKNPNSQITQAMKGLNCKMRVGLTGTILQNNLEEFWCVMDWAVPGCLGQIGHFKNTFSDPIEKAQKHSATKRALATGRKTVRVLVRKISHWFLRRTKALIKEQLPKKDDRVVYCSLTDFQESVYQAVLDSEDVTLILRSSEKCDCQSGRSRGRCCYERNSKGAPVKTLYFSYLAILRKVANHTALLQSTAGTSKKQEKYVSEICAKVFQNFPDFVQRCKDEAFEALSDPMYSGKMKVLQKLLKFYLERRDKVLLFSFSTKLLDVLESYCMAEGLDYSRLDGATKSKDRVQIVTEFNNSTHISLCLVSTMAGGLGLNFVGANVVILFDPTWNPANDLQAIDRAYRIGQRRDVTVLRLISLGTVEEIIYLRQIYKQQLQSSVVGRESARRYFEAVQGQGFQKGELFGIRNLFRLQTKGSCLTRQILEREGRVEAGVITSITHTGQEKEEEEKTKRAGVIEDSPPPHGPEQGDEPAEENRAASKLLLRGVLDFSSGSEDEEDEEGLKRKESSDDNMEVNAGQSLLQHGFSRLLQGGQEDSLSEEDQEMEGTSSTVCRTSNVTNGAKFWDTSSDSTKEDQEDEDVENPDRKQRAHALRKKQNLKGRTDKEMRMDEESDEISSANKKKLNKLKTSKVMDYSDESEDLDIETKTEFKPEKRKRKSAGVRGKMFTEDIESFTSSEDEHTAVKRGRSGIRRRIKTPAETPRAASFTNLKRTSRERGTIDGVLECVKEVAYTHSNQRVVGGSRAEERISRAAQRDVFQRKMYSQLPANQLLGTQESLSASPPDSQPSPTQTVILERPSVDHPVTFSTKSVTSTKHTTFIIGETPNAIRRQQLEDMTQTLKFSSVREFAMAVLRGSSAHRLAWLRQYYTSLNQPGLNDAVNNNFPQTPSSPSTVEHSRTPQTDIPKAARRSNTKPEPRTDSEDPRSVSVRHKKTRRSQKDVPTTRKKHQNPLNQGPLSQRKPKIPEKCILEAPSTTGFDTRDASPVLGLEQEQEEPGCSARGHRRTKRSSVSPGGGGLGLDQASSSGLGSGEADTRIPSSPDLSHGRSTPGSKPTAQRPNWSPRTREPFQGEAQPPMTAGRCSTPPGDATSTTTSSSHRSLLTDLIGDTSILDDLLKPQKQRSSSSKSSNTTPPPPLREHLNPGSGSAASPNKPHAHQVVPKGSRKDFWDILNEGNEESIKRLTDPAEVQRVCINTQVAARRKSAGEESSMWKSNSNFLWRR